MLKFDKTPKDFIN